MFLINVIKKSKSFPLPRKYYKLNYFLPKTYQPFATLEYTMAYLTREKT